MKRATTSTFILELPLVVDLANERQLLARFESGRRLFNAVLGEALRRHQLMRESKVWQKARLLKDKKERSATFRKICEEYQFTSASLSSFGTKCKNGAHWDEYLGAHDTQKVAERAFGAVQMYGFGKLGRPRFKGNRRPLHSMESKTNATGIRWQSGISSVVWGDLSLPVMLAPRDDYQTAGLQHHTKFCRIVWRIEKGQRRWYAQLMQEGLPPQKHRTTEGEVGLDIGPSTVAVVAKDTNGLTAFCPTIKQPWRLMKRLQRKLDRSRRATNPDCYNADGTWKKGNRQTIFSSQYKKVRVQYQEVEHRLAAERKRSHGELCNTILGSGTTIKSEKLSYRAFQKVFGRSCKVKAPGMFVSMLRRKAVSAGGKLVDLQTWKLKLSQYDHQSGDYTKKPLSQRWHQLGDGSIIVQRDVYSAFLAFCVQENQHHPSYIEAMWADQEPALRQAGWCRTQPASGGATAFPTAQAPSELVACRRSLASGQGPDVVAYTREPGNPVGFDFGTPCL